MGLALGTVLKLRTNVAKEFKLKVRKFWGLTPTFVEEAREKLVGEGAFLAHPLNLIRVNTSSKTDHVSTLILDTEGNIFKI